MVKRPATRLAAGARRQQLLEQALRVFARRGFAGASTRELAAAAGISEPILYRHFRSKSALFAAVLTLVTQRLLAALGAAVAPAPDARTRLLALGHALPEVLARLEDELRVLCGAAASHADPGQARAARHALEAVGRFLRQALAGGLRRGVDAETGAFFVLQIGLGSALLRPVRVAAVLRAGFGDAVLELMKRALL